MNSNQLRPYKVLFVDDELMALKYFSQTLDDTFTVLTAASVDAAIAILDAEHEQIGVLVTDQRMPGKQGVELLNYARAHYPQITRILATAYADLADAIAAVNSGEIFRYIKKPWDGDQLILDVKIAMDVFELTQERDELISAKMSVYQRLVMLGRIKDLVLMGTALKVQLPQADLAIKSFLDHASQALLASKQDFELDVKQLDFGLNLVVETQRSAALMALLTQQPTAASMSLDEKECCDLFQTHSKTLQWPLHAAQSTMIHALLACYQTPPVLTVQGLSLEIKGESKQEGQPLWGALTAGAKADLDQASRGLYFYLWAAQCGLLVSLENTTSTELRFTLSAIPAQPQGIDADWLDDVFDQFSR